MPDVPDRDEREARFARELARMLQRQLAKLMEELGDPPRWENISQAYWDESTDELRAVLLKHIQDTADSSAANFLTAQPVGVDWALVNQRAARWARQYTFDLVSGINNTTRTALQEKIANFFTDQMTLKDLRTSLEPLYGPVRADMIASTEITRAAVQGERELATGLNEQGVQLIPVHQTNEDENVCPICAPRNDQPIVTENQWPPLHVRCRCWVRWTVKELV